MCWVMPPASSRGDVGRAQRVQQGRLAVIDMAHDGDDRRADQQLGVGVDRAFQAQLDVRFGHAPHAVAEFCHHQLGGVGIERLRHGRHDAELHQGLDDLGRAGGHAIGEFLHGDLFWQNDVTHDFHLIGAQPLQFRLAAFAFALAAHRGERADAFVLALDRGLNVDAAGTPAVVGGGLARGDDRRLARGGAAGAGAADRTGVVLLLAAATQAQGFRGGGRRGRRGGGAGAAARVLARSGGGGRLAGP